jgi:hypothetical protein
MDFFLVSKSIQANNLEMLKKKNHRIAIKKNQAPYTVAQRRKCTASVEFTSGFIFK